MSRPASTTHDSLEQSGERCPECDADTPHTVEIEIRVESDDPDEDGAKFSREPYRVRTCEHCGTETVSRMNNA